MYRLLASLLLLSSWLLPLSAHAAVVTGAEQLARENFGFLRGTRFGLITNQTAQVRGVHLIDLMERAGVPPAVIFTPEHGLEGTAEDGVKLTDTKHEGIPVRSLYNGEMKPRPDDLKGLDYLVFDIQDIGVRYYTYISTMGLAMEAAAQADVPFVVLDRPNPLGGDYVAGFPGTDVPRSFTSLFPIPVAHGLTVGELASMIKGERLLPGLDDLDLIVVRMQGWERWMRWPDTDLDFVGTSPNIADFEASLMYAGTGLVEATGASEGRGTTEPFQLLGAPGIDAEQLAQQLNQERLPGLHFEPVQFTPQRLPGKCSDPKFKGTPVSGVRIDITDYHEVRPVETGIAVVCALYGALSPERRAGFFQGGFDDMAGTRQLRGEVGGGVPPQRIEEGWSQAVGDFLKRREPYLLYPQEAPAETEDAP
ncbi:exo-beta-N-acetylmuramidase NamZ family protein [Geomesophilobacter sediminis]|uniref:DUF1343 domain-containing protein n=1 Tax=Geomesophilobacter sediminis TaxID=2798584 RepID=A0A8J7S996_9BACT|nr:DUF1343 domain-containing protein [Geomesophilobacter sediminis]MBJ6728002.1 DUF1343 domain-containing protein [Geomesophilobacter sediminis]